MDFRRDLMLERLRHESFDVVIIGGGITGVGCALDAASRGLRTALIERDDFASGTSSKSSKLVHGGLRYLQQREFRLVYKALLERERLRRNAPHLVTLLPFLLPILTKDGLINPKIAKALGSALTMYDVVGGWRCGRLHKKLNAEETFAHFNSLRPDRVAGGYLYMDAEADDARLTMTVARTAALRGAAVANRLALVGVSRTRGALTGVTVSDRESNVEFDISTRSLINATGVWSDDIAAMCSPGAAPTIRPAKGIHITVPRERVGNDVAAVLPVPKDRRSLFVIPHGDVTYLGTTDTDSDDPIDDPQCTPADVAYLLDAFNASTTAHLTVHDVVGTWAGLRPLVIGGSVSDKGSAGRTADLSRRHKVSAHEGVVSVAGGKLTTYRQMAADAVDAVIIELGLSRWEHRSRTKRLRLLGADRFVRRARRNPSYLHCRYGNEAPQVLALIAEDADFAQPLVGGLPYLRGEVVWAVRHEMARTVDDVLSRRTRARLFGRDDAAAAAGDTAHLMAAELGWSSDRCQREVDTFVASIERERSVPGLPEVHHALTGSGS
jgi:glycerol-3-phosphate dehydrogenase